METSPLLGRGVWAGACQCSLTTPIQANLFMCSLQMWGNTLCSANSSSRSDSTGSHDHTFEAATALLLCVVFSSNSHLVHRIHSQYVSSRRKRYPIGADVVQRSPPYLHCKVASHAQSKHNNHINRNTRTTINVEEYIRNFCEERGEELRVLYMYLTLSRHCKFLMCFFAA